MTVTTNRVDRDELERRRAAILERVGLDLEGLLARRRSGALTAEEWEAWEELDGINFLLDDR